MVQSEKKRLFTYIQKLLSNTNGHLYRINGMEDHLHILTHVALMIVPSTLVKDIKLASSDFIRMKGVFPLFNGWKDGYAAFTETIKAKDWLIQYIKNQEEHHKKASFLEEYSSSQKIGPLKKYMYNRNYTSYQFRSGFLAKLYLQIPVKGRHVKSAMATSYLRILCLNQGAIL
ncbi:MAG: transposase [Cyclobacteriaceae bacterium]|nr:transposase [Cyclobacteriaceae bacterium]